MFSRGGKRISAQKNTPDSTQPPLKKARKKEGKTVPPTAEDVPLTNNWHDRMLNIWVEHNEKPTKGLRILFGETSDLASVKEILGSLLTMETLQIVCLVSSAPTVRL